MQSLSYLNGVASTSVSFTDNRGTNVIFDRAKTKDYSFTETGSTFDLLIGANIVEIINPSSANVRYKINLGDATPTLTFGTLPLGITVSKNGTIYTVYGIDSLSDWEAIKSPTVNLNGFEGNFSYSAAVVYNTDTAADIEFEWNVGIYAPAAQLNAAFSLDINPNYIFRGQSNLQSYFTIESFEFERVLGAAFYINCAPNITTDIEYTLSNTSTLYAKPKLWQFSDSTITIENPEPATYSRFGDSINIVANNQYIVANLGYNADDAALAYTLSGNLHLSIDKKGASSISTSALAYGDWLVVHEEDNTVANDTHSLWKKQTTGDLYTFIETIDALTQTSNYSLIQSVSDNYFILGEGDTGKARVYSLDETDGFTLEYTYTGSNASRVAITDTYYCISTGASNILVYNTSDGTLARTITNSIFVDVMFIDGDTLYASTNSGLKSWDLTTGTQDLDVSSGANCNIIRMYDDDYIALGDSDYIYMIRRSDGGIESTITIDHNNFDFAGTTKLIVGNGSYTDTYSSQGIIYIKEET